MTFGQPVVVGALILVAASTAAGAVGLGYRLLPVHVRKPVGSAVLTVLVLGFLQRIIPIALDQLDLERSWLYSRSHPGSDVAGGGRRGGGRRGVLDLQATQG